MTLLVPGDQLPSNRKIFAPYLPLLGYVALAFLVAATAYYSFQQIEGVIEGEKLHDLGAIADTKVEQISAWREVQKRTGENLSNGSLLADEFGQWQKEGMPSNARKHHIQQQLTELQYVNGYKALLLLGKQGVAIMSANGDYVPDAEEIRLAAQAMDSREAVFSDFHRNTDGSQGIYIDLVVPLIMANKKAGSVVGAAVLVIDPHTFLYPLIQSWPTRRGSAETLLVRREGNDILFLNELLHDKGAALSLRIPLGKGLPAAMAVRGETGTTDGTDYRGVAVVAAMREVPGTPWFMVAKVDKAELFAPVYQLKTWTICLGLIFAALGGGLFFVWLRVTRARHRLVIAQRDAALEREMLVKHFEYLTKYANDIILVADETGRIVEANERALEAYGYTREDLLRMKVSDLRLPTEDPAILKGQLEQIKEQGELRYEAINRRKDGSVFSIEVSIRAIEIQGAKYLHAIAHDITDRKQAEQLLRQQKNFMRQVVDTDPNPISVRDADGKFLLVNQAMTALHGMKPQELAGQNAAELFTDVEQLDAVLRTDGEVIENRRQVEFVERNFLGDVSRWFHVTKVPLEQPDGSVHVLDIAVDITRNRLAAEKLLKSAEQIEDLYDNAPCGYHSLDKDGIFVRVNNTELEWLGYARDELIGQRNFMDMLTPSSSEKFYQCFQEFKEHGGVQELELDVLRRDGTVLPALLNATAIYDDTDGHFVMSRSTLFDITTRRLAENALRESENLFRTTVDNAPIIIWVAEVNDGQAYPERNFFNQRWHDFTGHTREEALMRDWISYIHPDDAGRCLDACHKAFRQIQPFKVEYRLRRRDGVYRWMLDSGVPRFTAEGDFSGYIGTCIDITEQKQFEKMRAEMEHVGRLNIAGEMASGLAHELSQPLTACNNYLDGCLRRMDENDWNKEKLHKAVQLAHKQAERAGKIINHLKEMVRKQGHERILVDVNLLAREVMTFLEDEIKRQGISVHMALFPLPQVMACKVEIEQVLLNLYKNAIESMHSCPQRELHVSTCTVGSGEIMVSVSDSGRGIPPDVMENLFNPFQTSKQGGLGLGLAICRSFIESHGGRIWADSQREFGAEFHFTLPVRVDHD